jgi:hypothetical protein
LAKILKISHDISTWNWKITSLSNHKPGILNNYIRIKNNSVVFEELPASTGDLIVANTVLLMTLGSAYKIDICH